MQPISPDAFAAPAPPYLQNPQGWQFFLEAEEVEPGLWIGIVRIHTGSTGLTCRLRCPERRASQTESLQDAKDSARASFDKIAHRMRWTDEAETASGSLLH